MPKPTKKPAPAKKANKPAQDKQLEEEHEATYAENKDAIDKALEQCTGHLKKLEAMVAQEVIRRLRDYYLKNGTGKPSKRPVV